MRNDHRRGGAYYSYKILKMWMGSRYSSPVGLLVFNTKYKNIGLSGTTNAEACCEMFENCTASRYIFWWSLIGGVVG